MFYANCTAATALSENAQPLRECLGITPPEYRDAGWNITRIESELSIFCDVSQAKQTGHDEWKELYGLCAKAQCDCGHATSDNKHGTTVNRVINDKGKAIDLQFRESLGGTACSYIGCLPTHFDTALYSSMCGVRPPPALGGSALGTMQSVQPDAYSCNSAVALAGDPSNQSLALRDCGVKKLQAALGDQHCSRGVCGPLPDATVL